MLLTFQEGYFLVLPEVMGEGWGWESFEKESWAFKVGANHLTCFFGF